jgi:hypothetical protein
MFRPVGTQCRTGRFCMAPRSSVHSTSVHVPHSSPDTVRARDTDREIGNVCASDVQCNATLQSAMTIRFAVPQKEDDSRLGGSCR